MRSVTRKWQAAWVFYPFEPTTCLKDSVYYDYRRKIQATNENLTGRFVRLAGEMRRRITTQEETRKMMSLETYNRELSVQDAGYNFTEFILLAACSFSLASIRFPTRAKQFLFD
ncbi:MAG: 3-keto-5-aminohexanoate cleavage protein [Chlorobiaceae bacterium]|nr:3-keto-5-aminohexanoate cleavage protein [Chlorobiaceae bacterium]NTV60335.1 3-keto-5-aminohexanoate cleavage protein [Chlorobiaceae bacterium]